MAEDDDGRSWELTVRGLKRQLRFPGGLAVMVAGVDTRQGGMGGCGLGLAREGEKMGEGEKNGAVTGGARFKRRAEVGNGSTGWRHTL
jgi:hypothetical protein